MSLWVLDARLTAEERAEDRRRLQPVPSGPRSGRPESALSWRRQAEGGAGKGKEGCTLFYGEEEDDEK